MTRLIQTGESHADFLAEPQQKPALSQSTERTVTAARLVPAGVSVIMLGQGRNRTAQRRMVRRRTGRSLGKVVSMEDGYDAGRLERAHLLKFNIESIPEAPSN